MITILILLQIVHVLFLLLHDWVPIPPLNDVDSAIQRDGKARLALTTAISTAPFVVGLILTLQHRSGALPTWVLAWLWTSYGLLFLGALRAWWWPYLVRPERERARRNAALLGRTHSFLPPRHGLAPDSLHCAYHALIAVTLLALARAS
jgi:hypothetical protein